MSINHITLQVSDFKRSKSFYQTTLDPLGYRLLVEHDMSAGFGVNNTEGERVFWISEEPRLKKESGNIKSFTCLAFTANSKEVVEDFYKAGLEAGGTDNGAPGYRPKYHPGYYAAFIHDPDGYNIEAVYDDPSKAG